ncbi:hypothetical protein CPLU01_12455 [Colletotrichum plurivorum]|uniref:Alpha/beta hydrolase fold-3 domain-containing protein n=1 Tax=Colletotrichum plurivorum TaxID=2175906 RepID=A0A8H6JYM3_9PEZI|nr:hypothetical protein CPLU01_12455 [Colletotrichum plurivorum]
MRRWPRHCPPSRLRPRVYSRRSFHSEPSPLPPTAAPTDESVTVECGSSGSFTIDLHGVSRHHPSTPLVIYLPPFSPAPGTRPVVPRFLRRYPTAVFNYRWRHPDSDPTPAATPAPAPGEHDFSTPLQWPTPIHDVLAGYHWVAANLRPEANARRDLYVYSSHAGASLAASLALTESHCHERVAVRGLVAWNGIFDWSMFLPDHRVNRPASTKSRKLPPGPEEGTALRMLQDQVGDLFSRPADLLDPFASAVLFFRTPGMLAPSTFTQALALTTLIDSMSSLTPGGRPVDLLSSLAATTAPRRSALNFPPRKSTLKLPATLLLHDAPPARTRRRTKTTTTWRSRTGGGHTFEAQALELAGLMRRSLEKLEFKQRAEWDEDLDADEEGRRRVGVRCVEGDGDGDGLELGARGEEVAGAWLEERIRL